MKIESMVTITGAEYEALRAEVAYWQGYAETRVELARRTNEHAVKVQAENERLTAALRGAYEVYAGSDGFIPETAAEGYQQQIIKQMVDCISAALKEPRT